jgi:hypothetical protein
MDKVPGMSLGPFGQWFTRNETWAEQAQAWTTYLARSCYMLQQGKFIADIAYFYGEDNNITTLFSRMTGKDLPHIPEGYSYDFINADAIVNWLSVEKGEFVTPTGMSYKILILDPNSQYMTLSILRKIKQMVEAGATVTGSRPVMTPSLSDDPEEFSEIAEELWPHKKGIIHVKKGKVYAGMALEEVLDKEGIIPDFAYPKVEKGSKLFFVHRKIGNIDVYWVNNRSDKVTDMEAMFRVAGRKAEIWHPETGLTETASFNISNGATTVPLHLEPDDAIFVVFGDKTNIETETVPKPVKIKLAEIEGPWDIEFQPGRGAPPRASFETLTQWDKNADPGIRYFSGTASYQKIIEADSEWFATGKQIWIDLGDVQNLAEIFVNGQSMGIVWKKPFRINITEALKEGKNELKVQVTNLWVNRLIGDQQPDVKNIITWVSNPFYSADSPLKPSGLLGPVIISSTQLTEK